MKQMVYALQFTGKAAPANEAGTVLNARLSAAPCIITTSGESGGFEGVIRGSAGARATFESKVTFLGDTAFNEEGTITLGDGSIRFSTVGQGYLGGSADPQVKHGCVAWKIESGTGRFEGASGLITSNFLVSAAGEVTDHHFGVIYLK
ncbi:MAG TPA: hypothetical protein VHS07_00050 [Candidatus Binataceae bacterium]|jgi:hypothetical protein|nr:hypothetical protein [Candidatus Binataceae bacterium]